jgi:peptidoglycan/xylan/chitin deacetylase (PgdA/CDA1 family)
MMSNNFSGRSIKSDFVLVGLIVVFVLVVGTLIYFNSGSRVTEGSNEGGAIRGAEELSKHVPLNLSEDDILVSFRIDDITSFREGYENILENSLYLARKYDVTFDLGVIAKNFDATEDNKSFSIYENNQDVFEIVAHGYDHKNYLDNASSKEFGDGIPFEIQEDHIRKMNEIFKERNLTQAAKIFLLPGSRGNNNTIFLANKYGYKLITQSALPGKQGSLIVSDSYMSIPMEENIASEIQLAKDHLEDLIKNNETEIQIILHPVNFYKIENSEELIKEIASLRKENKNIRFGFISERLDK